jgi:pimeloyl-ACP methyl ester carboxylesterase
MIKRLSAKSLNKLYILFFITLLSACGGGGSSENDNNALTISTLKAKDLTQIPTRNDSQRANIIRVERLKYNQRSDINNAITAQADKLPALNILYDVETYQLTYLTLDGRDNLVEASALIALPQKPSIHFSPILSFQHGTKFYNRDAPTQTIPSEETPEVITAGLGYIVLSADYVGYGASQSIEHPYLLARPSAYSVIDMLQAAQQWLDFHQYPHNQQLFLTGYSEGGYVTMAAHKLMQEEGSAPFNIVASVFGAGPYDLSLSLEELFRGVGSLPSLLADPIIKLLLNSLAPDDSDIAFQTTFLERYFNGETQDNVHDWKPNAPIRLYHGKEDQTVPYESSRSTLAAMQARQVNDIELIDCPSTPSDHKNCVVPYWLFMTEYFAGFAEGL